MGLLTGETIVEGDFINETSADAVPANDEGRVAKLEDDGKIAQQFLSKIVGGTGADGALTISSGTTTIDLGGAAYFVKNYTSISITGTGKLAFSNPHANGTIIIFRVLGDTTITSTGSPAIDLRGVGAAVGNQPTGSLFATLPSGLTKGSRYTYPNLYTQSYNQIIADRGFKLTVGTAGVTGDVGGGGEAGGTSGRGGGALYIETAGAWSFGASSTINFSGQDGGAGTNGTATNEGAGGGGGGSAGMFLSLYGTLTADSGTYTGVGGAGGAAGTSAGAGGTGGFGGGGASSIEADGGDGGDDVLTPDNGDNAGGIGAGGGGGGGHRTSGGAGGTGGTGGATRTAVRGVYPF